MMQHWGHSEGELTCTQTGENDIIQYGIKITDRLTGQIIFHEEAISDDRAFVESILITLKEGEVEPVHVGDVIEDIVSEQTLVFACICE